MMQVDLEKCLGCGKCLDVCPVGAISLVAGKGAIDAITCLDCGACMYVCPEGAISEARLPVPARTEVVQPVKMHPSPPALVSNSESRFAWTRPVLSFIGQEILPRLADAFVISMDRRLSISPGSQKLLNSETVRQINGGKRRARCRCRGSRV